MARHGQTENDLSLIAWSIEFSDWNPSRVRQLLNDVSQQCRIKIDLSIVAVDNGVIVRPGSV